MNEARQEALRNVLTRWSFAPDADEVDAQSVASLRRRLYRRWMAFARVLGKINAAVLLTIVYIVVIGPVALIFRIIGKDLLDRTSENRPSYWYDREDEEHSVERRSRQF